MFYNQQYHMYHVVVFLKLEHDDGVWDCYGRSMQIPIFVGHLCWGPLFVVFGNIFGMEWMQCTEICLS